MNKLFRFAVVVALAVSMLAAVPAADAQELQEPIGDCPYVFASDDGGETWYQCDNYGRYEDRDSVTCYYEC